MSCVCVVQLLGWGLCSYRPLRRPGVLGAWHHPRKALEERRDRPLAAGPRLPRARAADATTRRNWCWATRRDWSRSAVTLGAAGTVGHARSFRGGGRLQLGKVLGGIKCLLSDCAILLCVPCCCEAPFMQPAANRPLNAERGCCWTKLGSGRLRARGEIAFGGSAN